MVQTRNATVPPLLEYALLLLAVAIFTWGLQAKLSLYRGSECAASSANSAAKLSTDEGSARTSALKADHGQPSVSLESSRFVAAVFSPQASQSASSRLRDLGAGPHLAGGNNRHGPSVQRRPPPVLS